MTEDQNLSKKEQYDLEKETRLKAESKSEQTKNVMRSLRYLGFAALLVVIVYGLVRLIQSAPTPNTDGGTLDPTPVGKEWTLGNSEAKVTLVEYADFQCPACGAYYPIIKELVKKYETDVKFVFRHFPLRQIHPNANLAAQAAEAAGVQGKFWEMHDKIFDKQTDWSNRFSPKDIFAGYAKDLGLNEEQFRKDLDSKTVKEKIEENLQSGIRSNVNGTPSYFVNGEKIVNPRSLEEFQSILDKALGK